MSYRNSQVCNRTLKWLGFCLGALLFVTLWAGSPAQAQTPSAHGDLDLDFRLFLSDDGASQGKLYNTSVRADVDLAPGLRAAVYGTHRYDVSSVQQAFVEKDWGGTAGRAQVGLVRVPFGIYDVRETYASGLIDYPMPRGDYAYHSVDWGAPGLSWSGGSARLQFEASGFSGLGTGIWDNQAHVRGGALRAQTYAGDAILGGSRWDGALQDNPSSPLDRPVHMTGLDVRYTKTHLLIRGEALWGTLAGEQMRGWYLDGYYRLPGYERWSLVARVEMLKPGDDDPESRQLTLGVRYVATPDWTLAINWRRNNGPFYAATWTPTAAGSGDLYFQAYHHVKW